MKNFKNKKEIYEILEKKVTEDMKRLLFLMPINLELYHDIPFKNTEIKEKIMENFIKRIIESDSYKNCKMLIINEFERYVQDNLVACENDMCFNHVPRNKLSVPLFEYEGKMLCDSCINAINLCKKEENKNEKNVSTERIHD